MGDKDEICDDDVVDMMVDNQDTVMEPAKYIVAQVPLQHHIHKDQDHSPLTLQREDDDNNIKPNVPSSRNGRCTVWLMSVASNVICIIALALGRRKHSTAERFSMVIVSVTLFASVLMCVLLVRLETNTFLVSGQVVELSMSMVLLLLWCAGLAVIMNPSHSLAVGHTQIVNGNLYVGSWLSFICLLWIVGDLVEQGMSITTPTTTATVAIAAVTNISETVHRRIIVLQTRHGKWQALVATSMVVVGASVRMFQSFDCNLHIMKAAPTCQDCRIGISIAVVATVIAILVATLACCVSTETLRLGEYVGALFQFLFWSVGLGYITFGEGPGHSIGNLFFATWLAFLLSGYILAECFLEWKNTWSGYNIALSTTTTTIPEYETELPNHSCDGHANTNASKEMANNDSVLMHDGEII